MSESVKSPPGHPGTRPQSIPLDEVIWQSWLSKNRAQEDRAAAARLKVLQWITIAVAFAALVLWLNPAAYSRLSAFLKLSF